MEARGITLTTGSEFILRFRVRFGDDEMICCD